MTPAATTSLTAIRFIGSAGGATQKDALRPNCGRGRVLADGLAIRERILVFGRQPYWGEAILRKYSRPRAQELGIETKFR
jgi:hypothetical protein